MGKRIVKMLAVILVVVVAVSVLEVLSFSELFPFKRELSFTVIDQSDRTFVEFSCYGNATDSAKVVTSLYLRVEREFDNQRRVYFDIQHEGNTELDSVTLKFQSEMVSAVDFEGYSSTSATYTKNIKANTYTVTITYNRALGVMEGSTPLKFRLTTINATGDFQLNMQTDINMHYKQPLELTQLHLETYQNITLH